MSTLTKEHGGPNRRQIPPYHSDDIPDTTLQDQKAELIKRIMDLSRQIDRKQITWKEYEKASPPLHQELREVEAEITRRNNKDNEDIDEPYLGKEEREVS
jgi:hypothetical protein